ncbi:MAG: hypothetical protein ACP5MW_07000 [Thermoplasmata archaeon]
MKVFTYGDLREYLLSKIYKDEYVKLVDFLKREISDNPDFNLFDYLYKNNNVVIFTAKNTEELNKKLKNILELNLNLCISA